MSIPPTNPETAEPQESSDQVGIIDRLTGGWARRLVWIAVLLGSVAYLVLGQISVVSYRYSPFLQRTFREVEERGFFDIWTEQIENLPSASPQWVVNGAFVLAIALVLAGAGYGAWLLLVAAGDETSVRRRTGRRSLRAND